MEAERRLDTKILNYLVVYTVKHAMKLNCCQLTWQIIVTSMLDFVIAVVQIFVVKVNVQCSCHLRFRTGRMLI